MITVYLSDIIRNLKCSNADRWPTILRDIAASIHGATVDDLQQLLELLISAPNLNIQIKLLSILSSYLLSNGLHYEYIAKFSPLYEIVQNLLIRCLPLKTAGVLNYILALLCCDAGDSRPSLVQYVQNTIRVSGCLHTMSEVFTGSMMYQDTWVALCHSLAACCRNFEINQNYCSHLVPMCVQRCRADNAVVCAVLHSLLQNNNRNIQLFLDCNGLSIFTRPFLQYDMCIQLLNTITEKSPKAVSILRETKIVHHLRDFLRLYGPHSQMGQWSTIILFRLSAQTQPLSGTIMMDSHQGYLIPADDKVTSNEKTKNPTREHTFSLARRPKCVFNVINNKVTDKTSIKNKTPNIDLQDMTMISNKDNLDNTLNLFRNVIREVAYWKPRSEDYVKRDIQVAPINKNVLITEQVSRLKNIETIKVNRNERNVPLGRGTPMQDLTFSFLYKENNCPKTNTPIVRRMSYMEDNITTTDKGIQTESTGIDKISYDDNNSPNITQFKPPFVSTPKRQKTQRQINSRILQTSKMSYKNRVFKLKNEKINKSQSPIKVVRNRSMSARIFSAINESCTTFVKSVKNIFRADQKRDIQDNEWNPESNRFQNSSCSYSFTNYFRKRDDLKMKNEHSEADNSSSLNSKLDSCQTCKDTIILQEKMEIDGHLKQTVKRLKHGLNLYGCNFKKICRTMWPRDHYMTPEMLYNIYRKLIVNGGHGNHGFRRRHHLIRKRQP